MRYDSDVTSPLSVRFDRDLLERLRRRVASTLVQHRQGWSSGWSTRSCGWLSARAWSGRTVLVVGGLRCVRDSRTAVRAGVAYYTSCSDEIDAWIADAEAVSERAEHAWGQQQELLERAAQSISCSTRCSRRCWRSGCARRDSTW